MASSSTTSTGGLDPCIIVIFGASGDLTHRKLVPSLYDLDRQGMLPGNTQILGVARTSLSDDAFREKLRPSVKEFAHHFDDSDWKKTAARIHYEPLDATKPDSFEALAKRLEKISKEGRLEKQNGGPNILFYLSVGPDLYEPIIANIGTSGLVAEGKRWCSINPQECAWQRIIVEKPFGQDLPTAISLNKALGRVFEEDAIFRIDHYLGKELVQNILVMRFANTIFEPMWNRAHVDHIQLTAAETVGVGSRAGTFYDSAGALRDMIQSHLLQILALVTIEMPSAYESAAIMREKIKLFNCIRPVPASEIPRSGVFGRYTPDTDAGKPGYVNEEGVEASRRTETYAAMRLEIDNWRWAGVPIYFRSGKKLASKLTEVVVQFKQPPTNIFRAVTKSSSRPANRLIINIAPREGISLQLQGKVPGAGVRIDSAKLDLDYVEQFGGEPIEAYGPLILDAIRGDRTLYKHRDEVESGWRICDPFIQNEELRANIQDYTPGSWGPKGADELLAREGRAWHNPQGSDVR